MAKEGFGFGFCSSMRRLLFSAFSLVSVFSAVPSDQASFQHQRLAARFGTKSHYSVVDKFPSCLVDAGHPTLPLPSQIHLSSSCHATSIYMITRHGSRWPTKKYLDKFAKLSNYTNVFATHLRDEGLLTPHGQKEAYELGQRVGASLFPCFARDITRAR